MTYKYLVVRREIYEKDPSSKINSYRSFSDVAKLFRRPYEIMLGLLLIALIGLASIAIFAPNSPLVWPLLIIITAIILLSQIAREIFRQFL